ncbi:hypothetical protein MMC07_009766 [Pseudocyphellaria aurata]|nr:hypothetical protein [Pseudocyphellaria aurata]
MKFNVNWCIFGYPNNPQITKASSQCGDVCSGSGNSARAALVDSPVQKDVALQYQYCQNEDKAFSKIVKDCLKCLNEVPKAKTLSNFVNALNVACDQQPQAGETLKLNFDVFAAVSTLNSSTVTSTASSAGSVRATVTPANPPSSSSAVLAAPSSSGAVASASAAAPANNIVRVGVGVGVGIGGAALVLAGTVIILFRRRSTHNREIFEREARARWEAEHLAAHGVPNDNNHQPQQEQNVGVAELIASDYFAGVAEIIAPGYWAGAAEVSAPDCLAEAGGRRLD